MTTKPISLVTEATLTIADEKLLRAHSELHHYTTFSGLEGIFKSNTLWAFHYADMNDSSEVTLLREPLTEALKEKFTETLETKKQNNLAIQNALLASGGVSYAAETAAKDLTEGLYKVTFESGNGVSFAQPFISSFCSHAADQTYEKENGLLSQWRGYGGDGGFCIVFDTEKLGTLLGKEFDAHYWVHMNIAPVHYAITETNVRCTFPQLIDRCDYFFSEILEHNKMPEQIEDGFAPFVSAATLFKHQGFKEEREIRIVAIPGTNITREQVKKEYPDFEPAVIKNICENANGRRYVVLFESLNAQLPIKRVIVGPSLHQKENYDRARKLLGSNIPLVMSTTPYIGK